MRFYIYYRYEHAYVEQQQKADEYLEKKGLRR